MIQIISRGGNFFRVFELFIIISNAHETFKFFYDVVFNSTFRRKKNEENSMGGESIIKCTTKILASLLVK
jgi:hypothetical protein